MLVSVADGWIVKGQQQEATLEMAIKRISIVPYGAHQIKSLHVVGGKVDDMASGYISQCHLTQGQHL